VIKNKEEKSYLSSSQLETIIKKKNAKLNSLNKQLETVTDSYIAIGEKEVKNQKRLIKINKKRGRLKAKIQHLKNEIITLEKGNVEKVSILHKINTKFQQYPYRKQKRIFGILFIIPWAIGLIIFFMKPLSTTIWWSLNDMSPLQGGGFDSIFAGFTNYKDLFTSETLSGTTVLEILTKSVMDITINLPTILIFSLFIAVLLNTKFKGHQVVKAIFFIPVIYNMTVINNTLSGTFGQLLSGDSDTGFQLSTAFSSFLMQIGVGNGLVDFLMQAVDRIFIIINKSGIQIILFIAALQSIPNHLYESAKVEGATKYEMFWKITFPMVSPMIMTALVYTIVDSFNTSDIMNFLTVNSQGTTMATNQPGMYSAISIVYFLINVLIIAFAFLALRKKVFYYD
jgi:ABC-type sugar transport system permease subunit